MKPYLFLIFTVLISSGCSSTDSPIGPGNGSTSFFQFSGTYDSVYTNGSAPVFNTRSIGVIDLTTADSLKITVTGRFCSNDSARGLFVLHDSGLVNMRMLEFISVDGVYSKVVSSPGIQKEFFLSTQLNPYNSGSNCLVTSNVTVEKQP